MSDNDVLGGPPSNTFDTPQKIVKKIIYAPTAASDMRYDSLAHIDYLMGGRKPDEDLMSLTSQNEYSYVLQNMGFSEERASCSIRLCFCKLNTEKEAMMSAKEIAEKVSLLRA